MREGAEDTRERGKVDESSYDYNNLDNCSKRGNNIENLAIQLWIIYRLALS